jgi:16S rRNA (guanine527-N7)-methyltransferase
VSAEKRLTPAGRAALERYLAALASERASVSSVTEPEAAWRVHVEDSLSGLAAVELRHARRIADLGSGPGFPGVALAVAQPDAKVDLLESARRKCRFLRRALREAAIGNASVVCHRSEEWATAEGREAYDAVTARAVGSLATLAELASPLLCEGGVLVAWKGSREGDEEAALVDAEAGLAMRLDRVVEVVPFSGSRPRHLFVVRKIGATPEGLPRRPGMAAKRPLRGRRPRL